MQEEAFLKLLENREKMLQSIFNKSFKPHQHSFASSLSLPEEYEDILFSLFDGYRSSLVAYGKFYTRQKQNLSFKIMGMQMDVNDAQGKLEEWQAEHEFYNHKVTNLREDFKKIDTLIKGFIQDNQLLDSQ